MNTDTEVMKKNLETYVSIWFPSYVIISSCILKIEEKWLLFFQVIIKQFNCPSGFVRARGGSDIRDVNLNSENWAVVKAALVAGMYPNLVYVNKETSVLTSAREKKVHFHPTSILSQTKLSEVG